MTLNDKVDELRYAQSLIEVQTLSVKRMKEYLQEIVNEPDASKRKGCIEDARDYLTCLNTFR